MTGRELLRRACEERLEALRKELAEVLLHLECLEACIAVYNRRGLTHPNLIGLHPHPDSLAARLRDIGAEAAGWEDALALVDGLGDGPAAAHVLGCEG